MTTRPRQSGSSASSATTAAWLVALGNCGWSALGLQIRARGAGSSARGSSSLGGWERAGFIVDYALRARRGPRRACTRRSARAQLLGAAASLREELERGFDDEDDEQLHEQVVADAKAALGDEAFAAAWARGETMTPEEIVAFCAS